MSQTPKGQKRGSTPCHHVFGEWDPHSECSSCRAKGSCPDFPKAPCDACRLAPKPIWDKLIKSAGKKKQRKQAGLRSDGSAKKTSTGQISMVSPEADLQGQQVREGDGKGSTSQKPEGHSRTSLSPGKSRETREKLVDNRQHGDHTKKSLGLDDEPSGSHHDENLDGNRSGDAESVDSVHTISVSSPASQKDGRRPSRRHTSKPRSPSQGRGISQTPHGGRANSQTHSRDRADSQTHTRDREVPLTSRKDRDRSQTSRRDRDRSRTPSRVRERSRSPSRDRDRSRTPSRDRDRFRTPSRDRDRSRTPRRDRGRSHRRDRDRSRTPSRDRERSQTPSRGRARSKSHRRDRDRRRSHSPRASPRVRKRHNSPSSESSPSSDRHRSRKRGRKRQKRHSSSSSDRGGKSRRGDKEQSLSKPVMDMLSALQEASINTNTAITALSSRVDHFKASRLSPVRSLAGSQAPTIRTGRSPSRSKDRLSISGNEEDEISGQSSRDSSSDSREDEDEHRPWRGSGTGRRSPSREKSPAKGPVEPKTLVRSSPARDEDPEFMRYTDTLKSVYKVFRLELPKQSKEDNFGGMTSSYSSRQTSTLDKDLPLPQSKLITGALRSVNSIIEGVSRSPLAEPGSTREDAQTLGTHTGINTKPSIRQYNGYYYTVATDGIVPPGESITDTKWHISSTGPSIGIGQEKPVSISPAILQQWETMTKASLQVTNHLDWFIAATLETLSLEDNTPDRTKSIKSYLDSAGTAMCHLAHIQARMLGAQCTVRREALLSSTELEAGPKLYARSQPIGGPDLFNSQLPLVRKLDVALKKEQLIADSCAANSSSKQPKGNTGKKGNKGKKGGQKGKTSCAPQPKPYPAPPTGGNGKKGKWRKKGKQNRSTSNSAVKPSV